jgi:hypothetical protein
MGKFSRKLRKTQAILAMPLKPVKQKPSETPRQNIDGKNSVSDMKTPQKGKENHKRKAISSKPSCGLTPTWQKFSPRPELVCD